ncbi:helix-turn-helix domain-containing protein [Salinispirillum marinum]|uniref:Helix-turn-helix domain-containing protein n=2 Tax=Saccharospirillaceae TaxID=255527 RepID=A0ABV8BA17_9GAMM
MTTPHKKIDNIMQYMPLPIPDDLSSAVESIFYLGDYTPAHEKERLVPDGLISLIIELDDQPCYVTELAQQSVKVHCIGSWLSGFHDSAMVFTTPANTKLVAVRFYPAGLYEFIAGDAAPFTNQVVPGCAVFGSKITALREQLLREPSPEKILEVFADWLTHQRSKRQDLAVRQVIEQLLHNPTAETLKQALDAQPYSHKHFVKLFTEHTGTTPKRLQRILRFQQIFQAIQRADKVSWGTISHDCGYYDQAHFIKEFKAFSGINPKEYLALDTDRQNFFPER